MSDLRSGGIRLNLTPDFGKTDLNMQRRSKTLIAANAYRCAHCVFDDVDVAADLGSGIRQQKETD